MKQFSLGLWHTLDWDTDLPKSTPILAFGSSLSAYLCLVTFSDGTLVRTVYTPYGPEVRRIDTWRKDEGVTLPQKIVGHTLPAIADGLSCPTLIDLDGFYGFAATHIFFDQLLPLFPQADAVRQWVGNHDGSVVTDLLDEFTYQKQQTENEAIALRGQASAKQESLIAFSLDQMKTTKAYLAFRKRGEFPDALLVHEPACPLSFRDAVLLTDHLSSTDAVGAAVDNLKRAFDYQAAQLRTAPRRPLQGPGLTRTAPSTPPRRTYDFNALAFALSKTSWNSYVSWQIRRRSNLMLLA